MTFALDRKSLYRSTLLAEDAFATDDFRRFLDALNELITVQIVNAQIEIWDLQTKTEAISNFEARTDCDRKCPFCGDDKRHKWGCTRTEVASAWRGEIPMNSGVARGRSASVLGPRSATNGAAALPVNLLVTDRFGSAQSAQSASAEDQKSAQDTAQSARA